MVNTLQFNLSVPTPYVFMRRFLKAAESEKEVTTNNKNLTCLARVRQEMPNIAISAKTVLQNCYLGSCPNVYICKP